MRIIREFQRHFLISRSRSQRQTRPSWLTDHARSVEKNKILFCDRAKEIGLGPECGQMPPREEVWIYCHPFAICSIQGE